MHGVEGPTVIPYRNLHGKDEGTPHHPGLYARYQPIDLDENNRHQIETWCARNPDRPRPVFGWGVCRHGFGLQDHAGVMTRDQAEAWARELNRSMVIGQRA